MGKGRIVNGNIREDLKFDNDNYYVRNFESLEKFYDFCETEIPPTKDGYVFSSHSKSYDAKKSKGTKDWEEAVNIARFGWHEGLKDLDYYEELADRDYSKREHSNLWDIELSTQGAYVDVEAYLTGQPECMCEFKSKEVNRFADIVVNSAYSCFVKKETVFNRGREIMKLVDVLEKNNIKTRIVLFNIISTSGINRGDKYISKIVAKEYNQMLDQDQLAFPLLHASFLRRYFFACIEQEEDIRGKFGVFGGYGYPCHISKLHKEIVAEKERNTHLFMFDDINHLDEQVKSVKESVINIISGKKEIINATI